MRLIRLRGKLSEIMTAVSVDLVAYKAARHAGPGMQGALVSQAELQGVIEVWCIDNDIEYVGLSPSEIKKHATGKGNAGKDMMLAAARAKWPRIEIVDDNNADVPWILDLAKQRYPDK
jgi:Holliday junction resolvasome RuvABC endonuclease subunit